MGMKTTANLLQRYQKSYLFLNKLIENKGRGKVGIKTRHQAPTAPFSCTPWDSKPSMRYLPHKTVQGSRNQTRVLPTSRSTLHKWNRWIKHKLIHRGQAAGASNWGRLQGETSFRRSLLHTPQGAADFIFNLETKVCLLLSPGRGQRKVLCHVLTSVKHLKRAHVSLNPRYTFDTQPSWDQWLLHSLPLALPRAAQLLLCQHNYTPEQETEGRHYLPWTTSARRWLPAQANHFSLRHPSLSQDISAGELGKRPETKTHSKSRAVRLIDQEGRRVSSGISHPSSPRGREQVWGSSTAGLWTALQAPVGSQKRAGNSAVLGATAP